MCPRDTSVSNNNTHVYIEHVMGLKAVNTIKNHIIQRIQLLNHLQKRKSLEQNKNKRSQRLIEIMPLLLWLNQ